jgi:adenine-specific DNA methylase
MDYIGSKEKLNDWIFSKILGHRWVISKTIMNIQRGYQDIVFLDACAGSGSTSIYAATKGLNVVSNDIME